MKLKDAIYRCDMCGKESNQGYLWFFRHERDSGSIHDKRFAFELCFECPKTRESTLSFLINKFNKAKHYRATDTDKVNNIYFNRSSKPVVISVGIVEDPEGGPGHGATTYMIQPGHGMDITIAGLEK